ncbi:thermonuclease family protein [Bacillus sp. alh8]|uniref:thermonuclease family protein n=1 Tax=Bacillus sp. alh8 TaxID=3421242 RepID=UPI003D16C8C2
MKKRKGKKRASLGAGLLLVAGYLLFGGNTDVDHLIDRVKSVVGVSGKIQTTENTDIDQYRVGDKVDVELVKHVDGDTTKVKLNGKEYTVRYLLIDTPETKHPKLGVQPYGKEASSRTKELLSKGHIQLEFDSGNRTDKYGRLLAYVYADGVSVQETLLKEGLARVAYVYNKKAMHLNEFEEDEQEAKQRGLNIWSKPGYVTDKGFNSRN